jgi:predicted N-acyltransferase
MTVTAVVETTISALPAADWDRCFPGEPENWAFYRACERAGPPGFSWYYVAVRHDGRLIAVAPAFGTGYRLDTTVQGAWKRITSRLYRLAPALLTLRLLALGSPVAEICHLGFAPEVAEANKPDLLSRMLQTLQRFAVQQRYGLLGIKDASSADDTLWDDVLTPNGFTRLPGLPTALLDLPYRTLRDYLGSLSRATRKDMRRKAKAFEGVRIERRTSIEDVIGEVSRLYEETVAHSDLQFECLPPDYFQELLRSLTPNANVFLYWAENKLIAFNFVIEVGDRLIDKYIGMDYKVVKKYNTYFNTWLCNVIYCIDHGIPVYQSGQAFYGPKLRLGCRLQPNWQYFRHRNMAMNVILQLVARFVRLDRFDPAIGDIVKGVA